MSSPSTQATEQTTLLPAVIDPSNGEDINNHASSKSSYGGTVLNLAKTCMGTGVLALPFAASQGGLVLHVVGLGFIAAWNIYSVQRLGACLNYCESSRRKQSSDAITFGQVAAKALGETYGQGGLDLAMLLLLLGIIIAYEDAIWAFWKDTPFSLGLNGDAFLTWLVLCPLSAVPHLGYLSHASALGLGLLAFTMFVIALYGSYPPNMPWASYLWPAGTDSDDVVTGVSHWFGCSVFGFGVVPLTYNYRASMEEPHRMVRATTVALSGVAVAYIVVGIGLLWAYPNIEADLLQELPTGARAVLPTLVRCCMVLVVFLTAPLLVVPCGELVEGKIVGATRSVSATLRAIVRCSICATTTCIAVLVPQFVQVLSFVGCCCVALVGFVFPPLFHLILSVRDRKRRRTRMQATVVVDVIMLGWGIAATVISSTYTFRQLLDGNGSSSEVSSGGGATAVEVSATPGL